MLAVLHDRVAQEEPASLSYLTALKELTIWGVKGPMAANEFLFRPQFPRSPLLPPSLQVLRIDASPEARLNPFWSYFKHEAAASAVVPVLALRTQILSLSIRNRTPAGEDCMGSSSLAEGFSCLRLRTERIELDTARDPAMRSCEVTAEQELCLFCLWAPRSYDELRIYAPDGALPMTAPDWQSAVILTGSWISQPVTTVLERSPRRCAAPLKPRCSTLTCCMISSACALSGYSFTMMCGLRRLRRYSNRLVTVKSVQRSARVLFGASVRAVPSMCGLSWPTNPAHHAPPKSTYVREVRRCHVGAACEYKRRSRFRTTGWVPHLLESVSDMQVLPD